MRKELNLGASADKSRKKIVSCKWLYRVKKESMWIGREIKHQLIAKGYSQTYGIDYPKTFAPITQINMVRVIVLLALSANIGWDWDYSSMISRTLDCM